MKGMPQLILSTYLFVAVSQACLRYAMGIIMRKKITAAITVIVFMVTSIMANPVIFAKTAVVQEELKTFTKVENPDEIKKNTVSGNTLGTDYGPEDEVTVIVELEEIPLLEHYAKIDATRYSGQKSSFDEYAGTNEAEQITNRLLKQQKKVTDKLQALKSVESTADVLYNYTAVMNGFAVKVKYKALGEIKKLPTVKTTYIAGYYEKIEPVMDTSTNTIGAVLTWDLNYRGEGTVVAVLDTGLDTDHTGFQTVPALPKFTVDDIQQKINESTGLKSDVTDAGKTYVSAKIPYAYDYADKDTKVTPSRLSVELNGNEHGTHVAGTIAAPDGDSDKITGVAPEAQLLIMKVFSDTIGSTGAYTEDILAALDDTVTLGADVINMSLGSASGFTDEGEASVTDVYDRIAKAGIALAVSAGNSHSSSYNNGLNGYALSGNPDTSVVGTPSTYTASTSVASTVNANYHTSYFEVDGQKIPYTETATESQPLFGNLSVVSGSAIEYVPIPNAGNDSDYDEIDLNDKIALVQRGSITFNDKLLNASNHGAIGIIVYNNQPGTISMAIENYVIPAVFITQEDGKKLLSVADKIVTVTSDSGIFPDDNANQSSDFSSWGVTPDLKLKPEISAPGENIYSTLPFNQYGSMSGTSMAAPHIAGTFALVKQYLNSAEKFSTEYENSELANALLMSTAVPAKNSGGTYYSPRKQGSGIVNVYNAVNTDAYLYVVDGEEEYQRPKLNLGDDVLKTGEFKKSFHIKSVTGSAITFIPEITTLTENDNGGVIGETPYDISGDTNVIISVDGNYTDIITLQPGDDVEVTVTIRLSDPVKDYLDASFDNGEFIDGFVILNSVETPYDLTLPFMGFYGDWTQAPLFDSGSANNLQGYQQSIHALYTGGYDGYSYLGVNPFDGNAYALIGEYNPSIYQDLYDTLQPAADEDKIAISPNSDGEFDSFDIAQFSLLRNALNLNWSITDADGTVIDSGSQTYETKSTYNATQKFIKPAYIENLAWEGRDGNGNLFDNNTVVTFKADGELDYSEHQQNNTNNTILFPITIDIESPVLENVTVNDSNIQIRVKDNQYVSAVFLFDKENPDNPAASILIDEDEKGVSTPIIADLEDLGLTGKTSSDLAVTIFDYAMNEGTYSLDQGAATTPAVPEVSPTPTVPEASPTPTIPEVSPIPTPKPTQKPTQVPTSTPAPTPSPVSYLDFVKVTPSNKTLYIGQTSKIAVTFPSGLTKKDVTSVSYSSGNKSIAAVSAKGIITAKKAGTAAITTKVTINGTSKNFTTKITVKKPYISFIKKQAAVTAGKSYTFTAKTYGISGKITYRVSNTKLAVINKKTGKLTAKKAGTVYVIAKVGTITKKYKVAIKK